MSSILTPHRIISGSLFDNDFMRGGSSGPGGAPAGNGYQGGYYGGGFPQRNLGEFRAGDPIEDFMREIEREFFGDLGGFFGERRGGAFGGIGGLFPPDLHDGQERFSRRGGRHNFEGAAPSFENQF